MPGPKCVVDFCTNNGYKSRSEGKSVAFHRFPKDPGLRGEWIHKCGKGDDFKFEFAFVCSDHFNSDDYKRDMQAELLGYVGKRKLKPNAVPSVNLPFEEEDSLTPEEKEKAEKEKHNKIIQDCLNESNNEYKEILSFEMFKKMRYKNVRTRRPRKAVLPPPHIPEVLVLKMSPEDIAQNFELNSNINDDEIINVISSEDDVTNFSVFINEELPMDSEGASCSADETSRLLDASNISNESSTHLKERIKKLEEKVLLQGRIICKLKRGILREKKMMEKIILATNSGNNILPQRKKKIYDEQAKSALLEIYSLDPHSYTRFSKALNFPAESVLSSWTSEVVRTNLEQKECNENFVDEEYIIETIDY